MKKNVSEYKNRYEAEKYDRIILLVKKGKKEELKKMASENGYKSLNSFITDAIEEKVKQKKEDKA